MADSKPKRSGWWTVFHWSLALAPFALVLALSIWGYGRYAWIPFAAAILCPLGAVLTTMQVRRDNRG